MKINGQNLHVVQTGDGQGKLLILLHGFPEFCYGWRHQIEALAAHGYRVWVPDQRGYNLSDKPPGIEAYRIDHLVEDVVGLITAAGEERALLVGHDWGAAVAWWTAIRHPQRVEKLAILNVPHPQVMQTHLRRNPAQWLRSWYIAFFQLPWLPEALGGLNHHGLIARSLLRSSRSGTFLPADLQTYRRAWAQPGALTAMLNWYRAAIRRPPTPPACWRIRCPTLMIWGAQDQFLGRSMAEQSMAHVDQGRLHLLEEASHWVQHEEPARVNRLLIDFLRNGTADGTGPVEPASGRAR